MRYVVKHKQTGRFLRSSGEWTRYLGEAQRFPNGLSVGLHLENALSATDKPDNLEVIKLPVA